ncbi:MULTISPECIES: response regulator [Sphingomonas]|uniref:Response regulator transcription factor n=1 Tax=Sphingomonas lycopersici TaxID=2951807 RepID=A0AA41Z7Z8_9SPHN|nr:MULTISPECIES: response regulator transcription factor [Sphingomonas]MCW6529351.1 response regulator transcription factor [Sphingomonas lycopersici]MCW6535672.1 response regulator transcription factor [Sphingomonas lycopersici]
MRLLVVEDNIELAQAIGEAFAARHLHCDLAHNAGDADILIRTTRYALVILDLGLPDEDGLDLLKRLRAAQRSEPIIILTARGEVENRIRGLSAGADDYMSKPFHFDELHARVLAILRRDSGYKDRLLRAGTLELDTEARQFRAEGAALEFSVREGELLELLMRQPNRVVPKRVLEDQLFGAGDSLGSNAVEVYIHRIRRHLKEAGLALTVQTVRGVGYMLQT